MIADKERGIDFDASHFSSGRGESDGAVVGRGGVVAAGFPAVVPVGREGVSEGGIEVVMIAWTVRESTSFEKQKTWKE